MRPSKLQRAVHCSTDMSCDDDMRVCVLCNEAGTRPGETMHVLFMLSSNYEYAK